MIFAAWLSEQPWPSTIRWAPKLKIGNLTPVFPKRLSSIFALPIQNTKIAPIMAFVASYREQHENRKMLESSIKARPKELTKWIGPKGPAIPAPMLTRQQAILRDMFGSGERQWGTGRNLPVINHDLDNPQGGGIIKSRDGGRTGGFFDEKMTRDFLTITKFCRKCGYKLKRIKGMRIAGSMIRSHTSGFDCSSPERMRVSWSLVIPEARIRPVQSLLPVRAA